MAFKNAYRLALAFFPAVSAGGSTSSAIKDERYTSTTWGTTSLILPELDITAFNVGGVSAETRDLNTVTDMDLWTRRESGKITAGDITLSAERPVDMPSPIATALSNTDVDDPLLGLFVAGVWDGVVDATTRTYNVWYSQVGILSAADAFNGTAKEIVTTDMTITASGKPTIGSAANAQTMVYTVGTGILSFPTNVI
jgi:hypothetical protein